MPRKSALIVVSIFGVVLLLVIVLLWSKGEEGSTAAFCSSLHAGDNPLDVFDRYDPSDVQSARTELQRGVRRLEQLRDAAPSEIHDDMGVLVDVARQLAAALDPANKDKPVPDFTSSFDRVAAASDAVTRFASAHCAVDLTSSAPPPSS